MKMKSDWLIRMEKGNFTNETKIRRKGNHSGKKFAQRKKIRNIYKIISESKYPNIINREIISTTIFPKQIV